MFFYFLVAALCHKKHHDFSNCTQGEVKPPMRGNSTSKSHGHDNEDEFGIDLLITVVSGIVAILFVILVVWILIKIYKRCTAKKSDDESIPPVRYAPAPVYPQNQIPLLNQYPGAMQLDPRQVVYVIPAPPQGYQYQYPSAFQPAPVPQQQVPTAKPKAVKQPAPQQPVQLQQPVVQIQQPQMPVSSPVPAPPKQSNVRVQYNQGAAAAPAPVYVQYGVSPVSNPYATN